MVQDLLGYKSCYCMYQLFHIYYEAKQVFWILAMYSMFCLLHTRTLHACAVHDPLVHNTQSFGLL